MYFISYAFVLDLDSDYLHYNLVNYINKENNYKVNLPFNASECSRPFSQHFIIYTKLFFLAEDSNQLHC